MKIQRVGKLNLKIAGDKIHFFFSFLLLPPIGKNGMGGSIEPFEMMERESGGQDDV